MAKETEPDGENRKPTYQSQVWGWLIGVGIGFGMLLKKFRGFGIGDGKQNTHPNYPKPKLKPVT